MSDNEGGSSVSVVLSESLVSKSPVGPDSSHLASV